ncbi:MAG TPA: DUF2279 domain-containing protein [Puia sp.]|nr:DUF2279 domain-containing protein [Puia sp.]
MFRPKYILLKIAFVFAFLLSLIPEVEAQNKFLTPSDQYNPDRLRGVVISEIAGGLVVSAGLYFLWYRKHPRSHFHFFNDNNEWLQMDKMGHLTTAYNIGAIQYDLMRWCGVKNDASVAIGSLTAVGYMSIIEILDGFSSKWGFSKGDMVANLIGTAIFAGQQLGWKEQRISLKFSYHSTIYPSYYPQELGKSSVSRILKDYNGQTYWLSFNIKSFLSAKNDFPNWLNMSVGYGAEGMIGASSNPESINGKTIPSFNRYRQFYLAPDVDLIRVPSSSDFFNAAAYLTRFIKFPAPTLEWNTLKRWKFHPVYF